jgi:predicted RNA polymerase sigma factor
MIFTCCHPSISRDSQIALALRTLCGFSIPEIASAFVSTEENINKRLVRARQKIRDGKIPFEVPSGNELIKRVQVVLETIYLLFNEGYSASKGDSIVRFELCEEAIRLAQIIASDQLIQPKGNVFALLSLMYLNASRFQARHDGEGNLLTMAQQDRSLWDKNMIRKGLDYLGQSTVTDDKVSVYHVLAAISAHHALAPDFGSTNWKNILALYDQLIRIDDSPIILLNRSVAVLKVRGAAMALAEIEKIENSPLLQTYHLFYSTKAEFLMELHQFEAAAAHLEKAIRLTHIKSEKDLLSKKLDQCRKKIS